MTSSLSTFLTVNSRSPPVRQIHIISCVARVQFSGRKLHNKKYPLGGRDDRQTTR